MSSSVTDFVARVSTRRQFSLNQVELKLSQSFLTGLLGDFPGWDAIVGRLGPGAVFEGLWGSQRYDLKVVPRGVPSSFFRFNSSHEAIAPVKTFKHAICKYAEVPKDFRGPRIVCVEHSGAQFCQQALRLAMEKRVREERKFLYSSRAWIDIWNTSRHVSLASRQSYCTVDMKDATDMLSRTLVNRLFPKDWYDALSCVRSRFVKLPNGGLVPLRCFATMGNGFCFILETLVFASLLYAVCDHKFSVFGDDLVIHKYDLRKSFDILERAGLVINYDKSCFRNTPFKETCGTDLIGPYRVEHCRLKKFDGPAWFFALERAFQFSKLGWWRTSDLLCHYVESVHPLIAKRLKRCADLVWNQDLQRNEARIPLLVGPPPQRVTGYSGLLAWISLKNRPEDDVEAKAPRRPGPLRVVWTLTDETVAAETPWWWYAKRDASLS